MSKHAQGSQPADFDPADDFDATTQPIIAKHYFGFHRKRACGRRAPGPGELARARELRKRGLHLRLIEAWRPFLTHPHTKRTRHMAEQELKSLRTVINFLWRDEQRHFEDMEAAGEDPGDHVFPHLEALNGYLMRE